MSKFIVLSNISYRNLHRFALNSFPAIHIFIVLYQNYIY